MTLPPAPDHRPEPDRGRRRHHLLASASVAFALVVGALVAFQGAELRDAVARFPLWAAAGAAATHLGWLACRGEAWRISLNAIGPRRVAATSAHAANALAVAVGALQALAQVPTRALALRRLAPERSPTLEQALVADGPVLALEGTLMGLLLVLAVATTPVLPGWGAAGVLAFGALSLAGLVLLRNRLGGRGLAAGLRVLGDRRRRMRLVGLTAVMSGLGLSRSWLVLAGFDLPHSFAGAVAFLAALGIAAALPIGLAASPAAALALFGAGDLARATAAGVAMAATALLAVAAYGALALSAAALAARGRPPAAGSAAEPRDADRVRSEAA